MPAGATRVANLLKRALKAPASVPELSAPDLDLLIRAARRVRLLGLSQQGLDIRPLEQAAFQAGP